MLIRHKGLDILLGYLKAEDIHNTQGSLYSNAVSCLHDIAIMKDVQNPLWDVFRERSIDLLEQAGRDIGRLIVLLY